MRRVLISFNLSLFLLTAAAVAAPNRIAGTIDKSRKQALPRSMHRLAQPRFDRGPVAADLELNRVQIFFRPSAAQQADLDQLLRDQQNPASSSYRQWLTPESYAERFGLSASDQSKVVAWLTSEGLTVKKSARGRNSIAFSGTAAKISSAFGTSLHRYSINGENHIANATAIAPPAALADMIAGVSGLNDFKLKSFLRAVPLPSADYTSGGNHYLAPADFATIYNVNPLYQAGYDGTGQSIAIVGESDISLTDLRGFKTIFGLPANDPHLILYDTDPGFNGAQFEANLDLEWAGAIAPKAALYYVYGPSAFDALAAAIGDDVAPVVSMSFGGCEIDDAQLNDSFRAIAQQGNAQGITILNSSGDSGASACDLAFDLPVATEGKWVAFPANIPEVTGVGGTTFDDASGNYWAPTNTTGSRGSALSYIPEVVWNENSTDIGLSASTGGFSKYFTRPDWQVAPGMPNDSARDVPDISLAASGHDAHLVTYQGSNALYLVYGTSAAAPPMASLVALLNQYQVKNGFQRTAGLGNINPQLYRLAQATPAAFHDITSGSNMVPCQQGSPDCLTGSFGYAAAPGYDLATGLGSLDANMLVTSWNTATAPTTLSVTASPVRVTVNDTVTLTATVSAAGGTPTGTVSFLVFGVPLGSGALQSTGGQLVASVTINAWTLGVGSGSVVAQYAGDSGFSPASASTRLQITLPTTPGVSAVVASITDPVYGFSSGIGQPTTWQADISLQEVAGVPALLTGFTLDGQAQSLSQYFPSTNIPAKGTLNASFVSRNLQTPSIHTFGFTGTDVSGQAWSRQLQVKFLDSPVVLAFNVWANPLTMQRNLASCPWSQQIVLDEVGGSAWQVTGFLQGSVDRTADVAGIFGTTHLAPYGSLQGTLCWANATAPGRDQIVVVFSNSSGQSFQETVNVNFSATNTSAFISASPMAVTLPPPSSLTGPTATLSVNPADNTQTWTATVFPANRTTSWLQLSKYSGTGPAIITLKADATGFGPGAYRALIVLQSPNAVPQWITVPVMWVNGPGGPTISSVGNAFSFVPGSASPGSFLTVYGNQLADTTVSAPSLPLGLSLAGVSATVNGWYAPILYASANQINLQIPIEAGAGPAVLGINNNGRLGGYMFQITPASPGIVTDGSGNVVGGASVKPGTYGTVYVTGAGDMNGAMEAGIPVATGTPIASLPTPFLPLSLTVDGIPALIQFAGQTPGVIGVVQINYRVPPSVTPGVHPISVAAGGIFSPPVNLTVASN